MVFNSVEFAIFFPIVFLAYWLIFNKGVNVRNIFIIIVSCFFYGVWDWRFLGLVAISSTTDYILGMLIHKDDSAQRKKLFLACAMIINLGILGFFKYFNFFTASFAAVFTFFGKPLSHEQLSIVLPVGISFYTFHAMSYTLDIYNKKIEPAKDAYSFFAFITFFPQLVAGPIERAQNLLPQFYSLKSPVYTNIRNGLVMMAIGLFKKVVIADRLAIFVNSTFGNIENAKGFPMLMGLIFFAFQLYLDFSAYSDIAIGSAKTFGFDLSLNFMRPYFAKSFSAFWTRWHISLSSWFRDYLYIPMGGNKEGKSKMIRNILTVFLLSGLWHGASWNFVIWGGLNGLFLIFLDSYFTNKNDYDFIKPLIVTASWTLSLIFFRAATFADSLNVLRNLGFSGMSKLYDFGLKAFEFKLAIWLLILIVIVEALNERKINLTEWILSKSYTIRYAFYLALIAAIIFLGSYGVNLNDQTFIYFQF